MLAEAARLHGRGSGSGGGSSGGRGGATADGGAFCSGSASRLSDLQSGDGGMGGDSWASGSAEGDPRQGWPARTTRAAATRDRAAAMMVPETSAESETVQLSVAVAAAAADLRGQPAGKPAPDASERWRAAHVDEFAERRRQKRQATPASGLEPTQDGG